MAFFYSKIQMFSFGQYSEWSKISQSKLYIIFGLYYGITKPKPVHELLHEFGNEMHVFQTKGVSCNGKQFDTDEKSSVLCDV